MVVNLYNGHVRRISLVSLELCNCGSVSQSGGRWGHLGKEGKEQAVAGLGRAEKPLGEQIKLFS